MTNTRTLLSPAYVAAQEAAAWYALPAPGCLRLSGDDRVDFLSRQTTNDLRPLAPGRTVITVLTTATARIQDVLTLLQEGDEILALTLPGQAAGTARHLRGKIFFMDRVTVADASPDFAQIDLLGPETERAAAALGFAALPQPGAIIDSDWQGVRLRLLGQAGTVGAGVRLLAPRSALDDIRAALAKAEVHKLSPETHDILRVEAGLPAAGHELTEDYTPLEVNLRAAISESKGCYTGQEIIARQITYDKVTRQLVGLRAEAPFCQGDPLLTDEGKTAGVVTSAVVSPRFGPIALAVLKRPYHEPGLSLTAGDGEFPAIVHALPFA